MFLTKNILPTILFLSAPCLVSTAPQATTSSTPNLRVEGPSSTIFEGPITSGPRNITVSDSDSGIYTYYCNVHDNREVLKDPSNAALDALDAASKLKKFAYDGFFDKYFLDFLITQIAGIPKDKDNSHYWGMLYNWKVPQVGNRMYISGCAQDVHTGDEILYVYNGSEHDVYLKATPYTATVGKGSSVTFTITDGLGGSVQPGAKIHDVSADKNGKVTIKFPTSGTYTFKAEKTGAFRSNRVTVTVHN